MKPNLLCAIIFSSLMLFTSASADTETDATQVTPEAFLNSMTFKKGAVELPGGIATLDVPERFRYIGPEDAKRFLEEGWGNPDGSGQIGMLLPTDNDVFGENGWAVVIRYQEDGHISDEDAGEINYDEMLTSMRESIREANKERTAQGWEPLELIGWAAKPHYDNRTKKLYWAKELQFGDNPEHTLNYNVRILGRKGVLVMNAVSGMSQLPMIEERMEQVIAFAAFNEGHRYGDFDSGIDKVAGYGIATLIGGKVAAKVGLLAKMGGLLVAFKKFIIIGLLAAASLFSKLFRRRKTEAPAAE